jgi:hypothetical protein
VAQEYRHTLNGFYGQLSSSVTAAATSMTDPAFSALPTITGTADYIPLTLSDQTLRLIETVWVTAHATGSTTVTVVRAKEGTLARAWPSGTPYHQADTVRDGMLATTSLSVPADLHVGARYLETDTGAPKIKSLTAGGVAAAGVARPGDVGPNRGGTYPGTADIITVRTGNVVVTTNASGDATITFRTAFPWSCIAVVASSADPAVFTGTVTVSGESASQFNFRCANPAGTPFVGNARINYVAVGY